MGLRARHERNLRTAQEKHEQSAAGFVHDRLEPGETIRSVSYGQSRLRGLEELGGVVDLWTKRYYLVLTDRRVFMVWIDSGTPRVVWAEPLTGVVVQRFKRGRLWMLLYLRRVSDGQLIRYRASRTATWEATSRITEAAGTLNRARPNAPRAD